MKWNNNENQHLHDVSVTTEHIRERVLHFGHGSYTDRTNLRQVAPARRRPDRERNEREDGEDDINIVAVEVVIGLLGRVIEPNSL